MIVEHEFRKVFSPFATSLTEDIVAKAAIATNGYPYLIQLVGYYLWEKAQQGDFANILDDVLLTSKAELFRNVHRLIFAGLSNRDRDFMFAMTEDEVYSSVSDIGKRMEKEKNFISLYRERLISAGVVKPTGHGLLCYSYPYMREFLMQKRLEIGHT
jgi:hypothetical protein